MKTINTIDDAIKVLLEPIPYMNPDEDLVQIADWLKELKKLREENESLRNDIKAYEEVIESEIGFGEGKEE